MKTLQVIYDPVTGTYSLWSMPSETFVYFGQDYNRVLQLMKIYLNAAEAV